MVKTPQVSIAIRDFKIKKSMPLKTTLDACTYDSKMCFKNKTQLQFYKSVKERHF